VRNRARVATRRMQLEKTHLDDRNQTAPWCPKGQPAAIQALILRSQQLPMQQLHAWAPTHRCTLCHPCSLACRPGRRRSTRPLSPPCDCCPTPAHRPSSCGMERGRGSNEGRRLGEWKRAEAAAASKPSASTQLRHVEAQHPASQLLFDSHAAALRHPAPTCRLTLCSFSCCTWRGQLLAALCRRPQCRLPQCRRRLCCCLPLLPAAAAAA